VFNIEIFVRKLMRFGLPRSMLQCWRKTSERRFYTKPLLSTPKHIEKNINLLGTAHQFFSWMLSSYAAKFCLAN